VSKLQERYFLVTLHIASLYQLTKVSKLKKSKTQGSKPCTVLMKYCDLKENKYIKIFGLIEEKLKTVKKLAENIKNQKIITPSGLVII